MYRWAALDDSGEPPSATFDVDPDEEMDDRDSVYLDTISMTSNATATANNRRSLYLSRQTIYHSANDVNASGDSADEQPATLKQAGGGGGGELNAPATRNGGPTLLGAVQRGDTNKTYPESHDEVSARVLLLNNPKTKTVTYSQWKSRTWRSFQDGQRSVDFVLAYKGDDVNSLNSVKRENFEANLRAEGLLIETEKTQKIHFVKIHAPRDVLTRYSEILKIKMPIKTIVGQEAIPEPEFHLMQEVKSFFGKPFSFVKLDPELFPERKYQMTYEYSKDKSYLFDSGKEDFFSTTTRIAIVHFILERQRFSDDRDSGNDVGIKKLLSDGIYKAAYPLHDGDCSTGGYERSLLCREWASVNKWIHHQPLDNIKEYFGVKVAFYFAWLGFYTHMLIPASIVGLVCFLYGLFTLYSDKISADICSDKGAIVMCPQCDAKCDYWRLNETCLYSRISYLIDNNLTVFFAFFMSFWAVLYLEMWKRYSANLIHRWGMTDFCRQAEHARPDYLARLRTAKRKKLNVVTRVLEPSVPFWKVKFPIYMFSYSIIVLFIFLAIAAVFALVVYRMSTMTTQNIYGNTDSMSYKIMVLPASAALINLVVITALNFLYDYLAVYLTDMELRRTQSEYDDSLTLKIYLFQFINYYSSIFYIAFMKGKFVGYPAKYNLIFKLRQEECSPGGCLMELCIQLVIIMVGKQALNAVLEMLFPFILKKFNTLSSRIFQKNNEQNDNLICCSQWTDDHKLMDWSPRGLYDEYLEMVIQYGFVTLFVVAFPLAPLFALLNNVLEMRLDAKKFLKYYRRPVPQRTKDIGVWFNIMNILGKLSVVSSAFIIAFSSNFIPQFVYRISMSKEHTDIGYLNSTLAYFNTADFQAGTAPLNSTFGDIGMCRYPEYRNPPWDDRPYKRPIIYWHILAARLAFIVVFQNVVGLVQMIVAWAIPDQPRRLRDQIRREEYFTRELIIRHEKHRAGQRTDDEDDHIENGIHENLSPNESANIRSRQNGDVEMTPI